jgi:hypothetical protein
MKTTHNYASDGSPAPTGALPARPGTTPPRLVSIIAWVALLLGAASYCLSPYVQAAQVTGLYTVHTRQQLPTVVEGSTITRRITVTNVTLRPLAIQEVQATCGCTAVASTKAELSPFGSTTLDVRLNTTGFHGPYEKEIKIETTPMYPQPLQIRLVGTVGSRS